MLNFILFSYQDPYPSLITFTFFFGLLFKNKNLTIFILPKITYNIFINIFLYFSLAKYLTFSIVPTITTIHNIFIHSFPHQWPTIFLFIILLVIRCYQIITTVIASFNYPNITLNSHNLAPLFTLYLNLQLIHNITLLPLFV